MVEAGWWREVEEVWKGETDGIEVYRVDGHGGGAEWYLVEFLTGKKSTFLLKD